MSKYLVVERDKVRENIKQVKLRAGHARIYGVLKGNAYGFGLLDMADMLRDEGISSFAVTEPRDLIILRNSGFIDEEILVMRSTAIPDEIEKLIEYNATATVGSYDTAVAMNSIAEKNLSTLSAHIKIDTGMGRYGFIPQETDRVLAVYRYLTSLHITGMYTHFNRAYESKKAVNDQYNAFVDVISQVKAAGFDPGTTHCANSSALLKYPYTVMDAVRVGSAFTGRVSAKGNFGLKRAGYAESQIIEIHWLRKNQTVGYSADYKCRKNLRAAVVPIGYSDGICLEKSYDMHRFKDAFMESGHAVKSWLTRRKFTCTVNGTTARVLGHVGMQHVVVDVTDIDCSVGDAVRFEINPLIAGMMLPKRYI
ncbi:MAG: alanine racemase [Clostridia bacterium]|nr:alanine racemase [Clostridia bacterium]